MVLWMKEVVIYEFGRVPIPLKLQYPGYDFFEAGMGILMPLYNMVKETGSNNVNKWIEFLINKGLEQSKHYSACYPGYRTREFLFIGVWNTGMGNYKI